MAKNPAVGARELKTRLGRYLRQVRAGQTLIVTDRGEPIAELRPLVASTGESEDAIWERLARADIVSRARQGTLTQVQPLKIKGKPLSETIIEDREDRF